MRAFFQPFAAKHRLTRVRGTYNDVSVADGLFSGGRPCIKLTGILVGEGLGILAIPAPELLPD